MSNGSSKELKMELLRFYARKLEEGVTHPTPWWYFLDESDNSQKYEKKAVENTFLYLREAGLLKSNNLATGKISPKGLKELEKHSSLSSDKTKPGIQQIFHINTTEGGGVVGSMGEGSQAAVGRQSSIQSIDARTFMQEVERHIRAKPGISDQEKEGLIKKTWGLLSHGVVWDAVKAAFGFFVGKS